MFASINSVNVFSRLTKSPLLKEGRKKIWNNSVVFFRVARTLLKIRIKKVKMWFYITKNRIPLTKAFQKDRAQGTTPSSVCSPRVWHLWAASFKSKKYGGWKQRISRFVKTDWTLWANMGVYTREAPWPVQKLSCVTTKSRDGAYEKPFIVTSRSRLSKLSRPLHGQPSTFSLLRTSI